jgi:hypothetical protein
MTSKKNDQDLELTAEERQDLLEKRQREADRQKEVKDSKLAEAFMVVINQDIQTLKLKRFEQLCLDGELADGVLIRLMPKLFSDFFWEGERSIFTEYKSIVALIERTEPARRKVREAEAAEIRNHPRDF